MNKELKKQQDLFDETKLYGKKKSVLPKIFFAFFIIYILIFIVFMSMFLSFKVQFQCVPVEGMSMQPTINPETTKQQEISDWVYVKKQSKIKHGDVVIFNAKQQEAETESACLIKRVIATEGDAVTICKVYSEEFKVQVYTVCLVKAEDIADGEINESEIQILNEDYISSAYVWTYQSSQHLISKDFNGVSYEPSFYTEFFSGDYQTIADQEGKIYAVVPDGEFFYLGDNRAISSDSRNRGTDKLAAIDGVVEIIIPNAENESSPLWVQTKAVFSYYSREIGLFFSNLWVDIENYFAI